MKNRGLKNNFPKKVKELFEGFPTCGLCAQAQPQDLHHICKRVSSSPFNAIPVCRECHDNIMFDDETVQYLLKNALLWLATQKYEPSDKDDVFMEKFRDHYLIIFNEIYEDSHNPPWARTNT